jgi:hypothetical protein
VRARAKGLQLVRISFRRPMRMVNPLLAILPLMGCDPFVVSKMVVTPSPSTLSQDSIRVQTNQIVSALAMRHGFQSEPWPYSCSIGRAKGTSEGAWGWKTSG